MNTDIDLVRHSLNSFFNSMITTLKQSGLPDEARQARLLETVHKHAMELPGIGKPGQLESDQPCQGCGGDNAATRWCPCGRGYCGHCECDCADWHLVVHEDHEGDYRSCRQPECVRIKEAPDEDDDEEAQT